MCVVVVVPAFASADQGDPPVVTRVVAGFKAPAAPHMRGRIYQPGGVQTERNAQECSPQYPANCAGQPSRKPAHGKQHDATGSERNPVIFAQPDVEAVTAQVRRIAVKKVRLRMKRIAEEKPACVCPPSTLTGCVRISFMVAVLVM